MGQKILYLYNRIVNYGVSSDLEGIQRWQIILLQQMTITFIPLILSYVVLLVWMHIYVSALLMFIIALTNIFIIILNRKEYYLVSRLLECTVPITSIFLIFCIDFPVNPAIAQTFSLFALAFFIMPFVYFSLSEWRYIVACCTLYIIMITSYYFAGDLFLANGIDYGKYTNTILILNHISSLGILISCIFYLIIIINRYYIHSEEQNQEILSQTEEIQSQQEEITKQRDSAIHSREQNIKSFLYAQKIQRAVLPSDSLLQQWFSDYFIIFNPLEYVSGDFYWTHCEDSVLYVATADCTGHGFPGALMSMLGISLLNEVFHKNDIREPSQILDKLREHLLETLHSNNSSQHTYDGMDIALIKIDFRTKKLWYAGANRPLVIIRKQNQISLDPDKMPIGFHPVLQNFTQQEYNLMDEDKIYLFTDGFYDQFGGDKNKKFKQKQFKSLLSSISHLPMNEQKILLEGMFDSWRGYHDQIDDITIVGLTI